MKWDKVDDLIDELIRRNPEAMKLLMDTVDRVRAEQLRAKQNAVTRGGKKERQP